jgi:hypothetical protein
VDRTRGSWCRFCGGPYGWPAIIGLVIAMAGIVLLAGAKPPLTNEAAPQRGHASAGSLPP